MSLPGGWELILVLVLLLLLFGASRLPRLARSLGQSSREFKVGLKEGAKDHPVEGPCPFCGVDIPADSKFCPGCAKGAEEIIAEKSKKKSA